MAESAVYGPPTTTTMASHHHDDDDDDLGLLRQAELDEYTEHLRGVDLENWGPHRDLVCRFCRQDAQYATDADVGAAVCACAVPHCYAHRTCLHEHVFVSRATHCAYCRSPWRLDQARLDRIARAGGRVRMLRAVRQAGTAAVSGAVLLACVVAWAFLLKGVVWVATGTAAYGVLGVPALAVVPGPCLGDLVVGSTATFLSLVLLTGAYVAQKRLGWSGPWRHRRWGRRYRPAALGHESGDYELEEGTAYQDERSENSLEMARAEAEAVLLQKQKRRAAASGREPMRRAPNSVVLLHSSESDDDDDDAT